MIGLSTRGLLVSAILSAMTVVSGMVNAQTAVLLSATATPASGSSDDLLRARLEELGFAVVVQIAQSGIDDASVDLIIISSSVVHDGVGARLKTARSPVVVLDHHLFDDMSMATVQGGRLPDSQVSVIDDNHPLANDPLSPLASVYEQPAAMAFAFAGALPDTAQKVAVHPGDPTRVVIFGFEAGAAMVNGFEAPQRRIGYYVQNARNLSAVGWAMFDAMVRWASPAGSPQGEGDLVWDLAHASHEARGCDLWQTTWAPGGVLLTGWGDCTGPSPAPAAKLGTMLARIIGDPSSHRVESIPTGTAADYNDYSTNGLDSTGVGHTGWKPASFLHVDDKLWVWSFGGGDNTCTKSRLKVSNNPADDVPSFVWADWVLEEVGYLSFVQYGEGYEGGPDGYVYALIPMLAPGKPGVDCQLGGSHFGLMRGNRANLASRANWEYYAGRTGGNPTWIPATVAGAGLAAPVFSSPGRTYAARGSLTYNAGKGRFLLTLPWLPPGCEPNSTRFCAGIEVWSSEQPWGPVAPENWTLHFRSNASWPGGSTNCGSGTVKYDRGAGEQAHFPPRWMSADGRELHLVSSSADCLSIIPAMLP
jgi:hypothetical protein